MSWPLLVVAVGCCCWVSGGCVTEGWTGPSTGFLQKSDPKGRNWKRRYFQFSKASQTLAYCADRGAAQKGEIALAGSQLSVGSKAVSSPTVFTLTIATAGGARVYHLCAESRDEAMEWYHTLRCAPDVHAT